MSLARPDETIVSELMGISAGAGGPVSPQMVLERARETASPLHACFEWDDAIAGEKYRLVQARVLLRLVVPVYERSNVEPIKIPLFSSVRPMRGRDNGTAPSYLPTVHILSDEERRLMLVIQKLEQARFQLGGLRDPHLTRAYNVISALIQRAEEKRGRMR